MPSQREEFNFISDYWSFNRRRLRICGYSMIWIVHPRTSVQSSMDFVREEFFHKIWIGLQSGKFE
jgi:hypothetical protein